MPLMPSSTRPSRQAAVICTEEIAPDQLVGWGFVWLAVRKTAPQVVGTAGPESRAFRLRRGVRHEVATTARGPWLCE